MKQLSLLASFLVMLSMGIFSCKKDGKVPDMGYNYFPDQPGKFVVYNVDSFYFDDYHGEIDTVRFLLKEKIESIFTDNEGRPAIRLERYVKYFNDTLPYSAMSWTLRDVWTENRTPRTAEKVEENVRFVKLVFPVKEGQSWNGNAQNSIVESNYQDYTYTFIDQARYIGPVHFDSVLEVSQHNELNLIVKKEYSEKYARNFGLVYKKVINVVSQPDGVADSLLPAFYAQDIMERVDSGVFFTYTFNTFGTEP